jgi:DtxR family transcriptional regulator, Mn-dependent transcriptional regulator
MEKMSESLEDYLEAICQICEKSQVARVKELSRRLGVKSASVVGALRVLRDKGLVSQEPYGYIKLTRSGEKAALDVLRRHRALYGFFSDVLGLDPAVAEHEACRAEHALNKETFKRLSRLQEFIAHKGVKSAAFLKEIKEYIDGKEMDGQ